MTLIIYNIIIYENIKYILIYTVHIPGVMMKDQIRTFCGTKNLKMFTLLGSLTGSREDLGHPHPWTTCQNKRLLITFAIRLQSSWSGKIRWITMTLKHNDHCDHLTRTSQVAHLSHLLICFTSGSTFGNTFRNCLAARLASYVHAPRGYVPAAPLEVWP